jgi:cold shock CspA family protein
VRDRIVIERIVVLLVTFETVEAAVAPSLGTSAERYNSAHDQFRFQTVESAGRRSLRPNRTVQFAISSAQIQAQGNHAGLAAVDRGLGTAAVFAGARRYSIVGLR